MGLPFDLFKLRRSNPQGFYNKARLSKLTHSVLCLGLHEEHLGQFRFCQELQARLQWIKANCNSDWMAEAVRDSKLRLTGRVFRFADPTEACAFKLMFPIRL
ncbi:hypothetical protein [Methylobacterium oxalidis]|uniref:Uncharacterized protein n=1 Tax=Methylobacterium oxalidis TaxID=944322 RepID=A0A512J8A7_9HYPH|nr:hypothetical protein [Methylobacterium oxalidis]GEP06170.1 hypothetical protein MOX02_42080 [Methylobacterium oxalidis]GJE34566.1 hypothetical protein LDDCCGHA_4778 [Methylobacterium oxalidis]GLS65189.1 hypothetical protein GCM10007888_35710 [Methylobacterium oxalidis]